MENMENMENIIVDHYFNDETDEITTSRIRAEKWRKDGDTVFFVKNNVIQSEWI